MSSTSFLSKAQLSVLVRNDRLQVNVLSAAMHIILHLPKMLQTAKEHPETVPRIVLVSSDTHYWATISTEAIDAPNMLRYLSDRDPMQFSGEYVYLPLSNGLYDLIPALLHSYSKMYPESKSKRC